MMRPPINSRTLYGPDEEPEPLPNQMRFASDVPSWLRPQAPTQAERNILAGASERLEAYQEKAQAAHAQADDPGLEYCFRWAEAFSARGRFVYDTIPGQRRER